jgi:hypothetical protein
MNCRCGTGPAIVPTFPVDVTLARAPLMPPSSESTKGSADAIRITPVETARDIRRFLNVPDLVYRNDPHWVPPLRMEVTKLLNRRKNPFFDHGEACFWLAWRDGRPVGRISAQINQLHLDIHKDATGHFGFLEAIDDQDVFDTLLATAESWLHAKGMRRAVGPYSLSLNDEAGVLVSGFDSPPMVMMAHSPAYYGARLEAAGYRKIKDLHAYRLAAKDLDPDVFGRLERATAKLRSEGRIEVRRIDMTRFDEEVRLALDIYNDAWKDNWGFLPVTEREAVTLIASVKPVIRPEHFIFALVDGKAQAILLGIPNINTAIADLGGRLLPFGWAKLLWRLKRVPVKSARVFLAGVRSAYRNSVVSGALMSLMLREIEKGFRETNIELIEFSWILEDNLASAAIARSGATLSKVYRVYAKDLRG